MAPRVLPALLTTFFLISLTSICFSQDNPQDKQEEWNPASAGPVTTWTAPLCGKGKLVLQPFLFYTRSRGSFDSDGHYDSLPDSVKKYQYQEQLFMQYGLTDTFEIDGQAGYQENYTQQDRIKAHSAGFGDSYLFLRYCLKEESKNFPHVAALFQLKAPTGKFEHADPDKLDTDLMGTGSWDQGLGLILTKKLKPFIFHADTIYSISQKVRVDGTKTRFGNYFNYDFGVEYFLPKGFNLMFEANGYWQADNKLDGEMIPASGVRYFTVSPGIGWSNDRLQTILAYQRVVSGANTDANDSLVLTCVYTF